MTGSIHGIHRETSSTGHKSKTMQKTSVFHFLNMLMHNGKLRFMDLLREVDGIDAKTLSKELQDMEMNHFLPLRRSSDPVASLF